jgi:predicted ATPase/DNA-binding SARP family transcriptional activator
MEVCVLGPLVVSRAGAEVHLGRSERVLLARLVLAAGHVVNDDALVDALWGGARRERAIATLQGYVHRLRRAIGLDLVERRFDGYALAMQACAVDVVELEAEVSAARRAQQLGDLDGAADLFGLAVRRFRGVAYADLDDLEAAVPERRRLEELRRHLVEARLEIDLARARYSDVIQGAEAVVGADPTNERAWWLLMRAFGESGQQADALDAYARARRILAAELGIEPSSLLRQAEQDVLHQRGAQPRAGDAAGDAGDVPPGNIPFEVDAFIGRAKELDDIAAALRDYRLVTLVGAGGAGKTRLALQVASRAAAHHAHGAWAVELAPVRCPDDVAATVAAALRADEHPGGDPTESVVHWLRDREVLLVLDNCEHVLDAVVALVARLLGSCPTTRILATSREQLRARGEAVVDVAPLSLPHDDAPGTTSAHDSDAVNLFLDRARAADPAFVSDDATVSLVAAACQRLDGLPLALEIAAAQLRWLSLADLVERLDGRFALVATGRRDADERQRTLEGVVAWSYATLSSAEQALFRRVACLPHSFTLDAVEIIGGGDPVPVGAEHHVLSCLVDKSLVMALAPDAGSRRYRLLGTLRQYAAERRAELDESDEADERLLAWGRAFVADIEAAIRTPGQDRAMAVAALERVNLGGVLDVAVRRGALIDALRIVSAVPIGPNAERDRSLDDLLRRTPSAPPQLRARAWATRAQLAFDRNDVATSIECAAQCATASAETADPVQVAWSRFYVILGHWTAGDHRRVAELLPQLLDEFTALDLDDGAAYLRWIASLVTADVDEATALAAAAASGFRALEMGFGLAHALEAQALVALRAADLVLARSALAEALQSVVRAEHAGCTAHCLEAVAAYAVDGGWPEEAAGLLVAADRLRRRTGYGMRAWEAAGHARVIAALPELAKLLPDAHPPDAQPLAITASTALDILARPVAR